MAVDEYGGYDYEPYKRAKEGIQRSAAGRSAAAARVTPGSDIPGVSSAIRTRNEYKMQEAIAPAMANIDIRYEENRQRYNQWKEAKEFRDKQYKEAKDYQSKMDWINGVAQVIGIGATIFAGPLAGLLAKKGADVVGDAVVGEQPGMNPDGGVSAFRESSYQYGGLAGYNPTSNASPASPYKNWPIKSSPYNNYKWSQ